MKYGISKFKSQLSNDHLVSNERRTKSCFPNEHSIKWVSNECCGNFEINERRGTLLGKYGIHSTTFIHSYCFTTVHLSISTQTAAEGSVTKFRCEKNIQYACDNVCPICLSLFAYDYICPQSLFYYILGYCMPLTCFQRTSSINTMINIFYT